MLYTQVRCGHAIVRKTGTSKILLTAYTSLSRNQAVNGKAHPTRKQHTPDATSQAA